MAALQSSFGGASEGDHGKRGRGRLGGDGDGEGEGEREMEISFLHWFPALVHTIKWQHLQFVFLYFPRPRRGTAGRPGQCGAGQGSSLAPASWSTWPGRAWALCELFASCLCLVTGKLGRAGHRILGEPYSSSQTGPVAAGQ